MVTGFHNGGRGAPRGLLKILSEDTPSNQDLSEWVCCVCCIKFFNVLPVVLKFNERDETQLHLKV